MPPDWELLAQRSCRWAPKKQGILWDWLVTSIWLLLVDAKLETGTNIREVASYSSRPGCFGPAIPEVRV